jgi:hypothetical protein
MDRAAAGNAGGVDDPVEAVGHGGQHSGDRGFVGHVGRHECEPRPKVGRAGQVGANDGAAFGQQSPGGGQADARRRTRHDERARTGTISAHHLWVSLRVGARTVRVRTGPQ